MPPKDIDGYFRMNCRVIFLKPKLEIGNAPLKAEEPCAKGNLSIIVNLKILSYVQKRSADFKNVFIKKLHIIEIIAYP